MDGWTYRQTHIIYYVGVSRCWALIEEHTPSLSMETEERYIILYMTL